LWTRFLIIKKFNHKKHCGSDQLLYSALFPHPSLRSALSNGGEGKIWCTEQSRVERDLDIATDSFRLALIKLLTTDDIYDVDLGGFRGS